MKLIKLPEHLVKLAQTPLACDTADYTDESYFTGVADGEIEFARELLARFPIPAIIQIKNAWDRVNSPSNLKNMSTYIGSTAMDEDLNNLFAILKEVFSEPSPED